MSDYLREVLYPLGFLPAFFFTARMLLQWIKSEKKGESYVMPAFWKLSLCGNLLLFIHAFIQVQFHVCMIQGCNAVISWRNLNLMRPADCQVTTRRTIQILLITLSLTLTAFIFQAMFLVEGSEEWFRIPATPWQTNAGMQVALIWHLLGFFGLILFSSRFWVQWWCIERNQISYLSASFWWFSLIGEGLCLVYFVRIADPVNYIGPSFALIPYVRNLLLIYKRKTLSSQGLSR